MKAKRIRTALIGSGANGLRRQLDNLAAADGYELVAVVGEGVDSLDAKTFAPDVSRYIDEKEALSREDIEAVVVAGVPDRQAALSMAAIKSGKHVLCEAPGGVSSRELRTVEEASRKAGRKVAYLNARQRRGASPLAKRYFERGAPGALYQADIRRYLSASGEEAGASAPREAFGRGVLLTEGSVLLDQMLWILGWPAVSSATATLYGGTSNGRSGKTSGAGETHCEAVFRTAIGVNIHLSLALAQPAGELDQLRIWGVDGGIELSAEKPFRFTTDSGHPNQMIEHASGWKDPLGDEAHVYEAFRQWLLGEAGEAGTTLPQSILLMEAIEAAYRSAEEGKEVVIRGQY